MNTAIRITIIDREERSHILEAPTDIGMNLMELCKAFELPVAGTCGGMALCASCHGYVLSDHDLGNPGEAEEDMLDQAFLVQSNSRLCCQLAIRDHMDGLIFKLAESGL
ncbi:MAG: 2Fe-2S iron-sulfur cluster binding domain-containing protein [Saprospiraceae bacterium]|nr:2Fe-2S iron-sulfur cluster binding domain-containing protein [Saprospiraceae bacterium]MCB9320580.1 2Fe-2S iron-sulfur cluster binding domain-containing protein [Lewinellaceae bacterium]